MAPPSNGMMNAIRMLTSVELWRYRDHLLRLGTADRRLRFGMLMSDEGIAAFVRGLDPWNTRIFAAFAADLGVVAAIQVAITADGTEVAVSAEPHVRGLGLGTDLIDRALLWARNRGLRRACVQCLAENHVLRRIANRAGMTVTTMAGESEAVLALPRPTLLSMLREIWAEQLGTCAYGLIATSAAVPRVPVDARRSPPGSAAVSDRPAAPPLPVPALER